jgi:hypothetical protein
VFTNLQIRSSWTVEFHCSSRPSLRASPECRAVAEWNWNEKTNHILPINIVSCVELFLGGKLETIEDLEIRLKWIRSVHIDLHYFASFVRLCNFISFKIGVTLKA